MAQFGKVQESVPEKFAISSATNEEDYAEYVTWLKGLTPETVWPLKKDKNGNVKQYPVNVDDKKDASGNVNESARGVSRRLNTAAKIAGVTLYKRTVKRDGHSVILVSRLEGEAIEAAIKAKAIKPTE